MSRPIPVILSAVLLGILAAFQLLAGAAMVVVAVMTRHKSLPTMPPGPTPLPASLMPVLFIGVAVFYIAVATWFIFTLIGLVRLRSWARYSQLVIAGLMAAFSGFGLVVMAFMPFMTPRIAGPEPSANIMHGVFLFIGAIYAIFTAIGIAQLIYFNRARTRALFLGDAPLSLTPPDTFTGRRRPTAIAVISWLFMISAPFCALYAFLPFPAFLFGVNFYAPWSHVIYAIFGLISFAVGYGLYRLRPEARVAVLVWLGFGLFNMLAIFTPWGLRNFHTYMQQFMVHSAALDMSGLFASPVTLIPSLVIGVGFSVFVLWLLQRHRDAFTPAALPPPALTPTPYEGTIS